MDLDNLATRLFTSIEAGTEDIRKSMNKNIHILDLSRTAMEINRGRGSNTRKNSLSKLEYNELYDKFIIAIENIVGSISPEFVAEYNIEKRSILVKFNSDNYILISPSYSAAQSIVSRVSRTKGLRTSIFGVEKYKTTNKIGNQVTKYRTKVDIGHTPSSDGLEGAISPATEKIKELGDFIEGFEHIPQAKEFASNIRNILSKLSELKYNISVTFKNKVPELFLKLNKGNLAEAYIIATIHTGKHNRGVLSPIEKKLVAEAKLLAKEFLRVYGSNTPLQDIEEGIIKILSGNSQKLSIHPIKKSKPSKIGTITGVLPKSYQLNINIRTPKGQFTSLTSIQNLMNQRLHDQIQQNMGKGNARNILNYRTGRFASSAKVTNMRIARDGAIEALYTYMKMPYATFEPDGRQGIPSSRDPRKLIERSMRQIATTLINNRLRAIPS